MADYDQEEPNIYIIPVNCGMSDSVGPFKVRNLVEAAVADALAIRLLLQIPFVPRVRVIITVLVCLGLTLLFLYGIKDESITSFVINYVKFKAKSGKLCLRVAGLTKTDLATAEYSSNFEKLTANITNKIRKAKRKADEE